MVTPEPGGGGAGPPPPALLRELGPELAQAFGRRRAAGAAPAADPRLP
jgi:hypothetical protein